MARDNAMPPVRLLVVENDPQQRTDIIETLTGWNLECYAAEAPADADDTFSALMEDAILKARRYRCHLALVDMRLRDDSDYIDTSGLTLVSKLAPTVSIILSGKGDRKTVRAALDPSLMPPTRAYDFVGKEDGPEELRIVIEEASKSIWCRRDVEIVRARELEPDSLMKRFALYGDRATTDQIDDILRRLFPDAKRLRLESLDDSRHRSSAVTRQRSLVIRVFEDDNMRRVIVKFARSGRISQELTRFEKARRQFNAGRYAQPHGQPIELWDLGGTAYEFIGDDQNYPILSLSAYYKSHSSEEIDKALRNFQQFWQHLYRTQPDSSTRAALFEACLKSFGNTWCDRLLRHHADRSMPTYPESLRHLGLPDPVSWLIEKVNLVAFDDFNTDDSPDTEIAMIHGDLNGDNLLVDERQDVWVIDYERTGFGPVLLDFASLEVDILTRIASLKADQPEFLALAMTSAVQVDARRPMDTTMLVLRSPEAFKAFTVSGAIRKLALETAGGYFDQKEYLWCMLLSAIGAFIQDVAGADSVRRSYLLAGVLCHRLDHFHDYWPPAAWLGGLDANARNWLDPSGQRAYQALIQRKVAQLTLVRQRIEAYSSGATPSELKREEEQLEAELREFGYEPLPQW